MAQRKPNAAEVAVTKRGVGLAIGIVTSGGQWEVLVAVMYMRLSYGRSATVTNSQVGVCEDVRTWQEVLEPSSGELGVFFGSSAEPNHFPPQRGLKRPRESKTQDGARSKKRGALCRQWALPASGVSGATLDSIPWRDFAESWNSSRSHDESVEVGSVAELYSP